MTAAIGVLTNKPLARLLEEGGSSAWVLNRPKALNYPYVVCMKNAPPESGHGQAFVVAKIANIAPAPGHPNRWVIEFGDYAEVQVPKAWGVRRNPVRYMTLEEVGIDLGKLKFREPPKRERSTGDSRSPSAGRLTISEAKAGLAETFGVSPEAIEITIRG